MSDRPSSHVQDDIRNQTLPTVVSITMARCTSWTVNTVQEPVASFPLRSPGRGVGVHRCLLRGCLSAWTRKHRGPASAFGWGNSSSRGRSVIANTWIRPSDSPLPVPSAKRPTKHRKPNSTIVSYSCASAPQIVPICNNFPTPQCRSRLGAKPPAVTVICEHLDDDTELDMRAMLCMLWLMQVAHDSAIFRCGASQRGVKTQ